MPSHAEHAGSTSFKSIFARSASCITSQPGAFDLGHRPAEVLIPGRLADVAIRAKPIGLALVGLFVGRAVDHDSERSRALVGTQPLEHFEPIEPWHVEVEQDKAWQRANTSVVVFLQDDDLKIVGAARSALASGK